MKALDKIKDMIDFCDAVGCHRALYESLKAVEAELEALQQPKSCDGCKYFNKSINGGLCFRLDITVSTTFYCQGYEVKGAMR